MLLAHVEKDGTQIIDKTVSFDTFNADKYGCGGAFGQLPVLKLPNGKVLGQKNAILRLISQMHKALTGECLYPGNANPMQSYIIDQWMSKADDFFDVMIHFTVWQTNKDENFTNFICEWLPKWLSNVENHFATMKTKWLAGTNITRADFACGSHIVRMAYNPTYENKHIVETVIGKYPMTKAWAENFRDYTKEWFANNNHYKY